MGKIKDFFKKHFTPRKIIAWTGALSILGIIFAVESCKTYAYTMDTSGNLVSSNMIDCTLDLRAPTRVDYRKNYYNGYQLTTTDSNGGYAFINQNFEFSSTNQKYNLNFYFSTNSGNIGYVYLYRYLDDTYTNGFVEQVGRYTENGLKSINFTSISNGVEYKYFRVRLDSYYSGMRANYTELMLSPITDLGYVPLFEPYGKTYYSSTNYDNAYNNGYAQGSLDSLQAYFSGVNLKENYFTYQTITNEIASFSIIHNGQVYTTEAMLGETPNYDEVYYDAFTMEDINTSNGLFYGSSKTLYQVYSELKGDYSIQLESANPTTLYSTYVFASPVDFNNTYFIGMTNVNGVRGVEFYDSNNNLLGIAINPNSSYTFENVSKVVVNWNSNFYYGSVYLSTSLEASQYNNGYQNGYLNGYNNGTDNGIVEGRKEGIVIGKEQGIQEGYTNGYNEGSVAGAQIGYETGFQEGLGLSSDSYNSGYARSDIMQVEAKFQTIILLMVKS